MLFEDLRTIHEDLERLEQGVADRMLEDPRHVSMQMSSLLAALADSMFHRPGID